jgi:cation diffusion facilitator family transporter
MGREFRVMPSRDEAAPDGVAAAAKLRVALISVGAALFLTGAKASVGIWTGSLALLSEAAHSGLDLFASAITAVSVRVADRPADKTHHYGHGKIESLSALFEAALLLITCAWIFHEAIHRLAERGPGPVINVYSFLVILLAIGIDLYRYRALMKTAVRYQSQALEADAMHFYSDILGSSLVLVGLIAVAVGIPSADALAAILVAVWVATLAIRLGKKNIDILLDTVPQDYADQVRKIASREEGVLTVESVRLRRSGSSLFADLRVGLDRTLPFERAHTIARELEQKLAAKIPGLDAVVHTDPTLAPNEALDGGILNFIRTRGLQAHHLILHRDQDGYSAELHLEVDGQLSIREAHALASELEQEIPILFPNITSVRIHIEEIGCLHYQEITQSEPQPELLEQISQICAAQIGENRCHDISLSRSGGIFSATLHCLFPDNTTVNEAHRQTTRLEEELRRDMPILDRVLIHAEPMHS